MFSVTEFVSAKGGQGCTTTAAAYAVLRSQAGVKVLLLSDSGDVFAVLGVSIQTDAIVNVSTMLDVACAADQPPTWPASEYDELVIDVGTPGWLTTDTPPIASTRRFLVTKACYLALRAAVSLDDHFDGVVLIEEVGRALTAADVACVTGVRVVATVLHDIAVTRTVDAGLLASRVPALFSSALRPLLDSERNQDNGGM